MSNILVSVIVPVYNTEQYIVEALDSIINQSYKNIEIICINDGSTDNSLSILNDYASKDSRIKVFSQKNKGLPATKNVGVSLANGEYICFVDSDDIISLNTIESSVKLVEKTGCDVVVNYLHITNRHLDSKILKRPWMASTQPFIKKEVFINNPDIHYDENLTRGEDIVFSNKLMALIDNVALNNESIYFYRKRPGQMTDPKWDQEYPFYINQWINKLTEFYNKYDLWNENKNHILQFIATSAFPIYLSRHLTYSNRKEIFKSIKSFISEYDLKKDVKIKNKIDFIFILFLSCKNMWQFEPIRLTVDMYMKITRCYYYKVNYNNLFKKIIKSK